MLHSGRREAPRPTQRRTSRKRSPLSRDAQPPTTPEGQRLAGSGEAGQKWRKPPRERATALQMALVWLGLGSACGILWGALFSWIQGLLSA